MKHISFYIKARMESEATSANGEKLDDTIKSEDVSVRNVKVTN